MKRLFSLLIIAGLLASCAEPTVLDPPFGESVRHMIAIQTTDPSLDAPGLDGSKALSVFKTYQEGDGGNGDGDNGGAVILLPEGN